MKHLQKVMVLIVWLVILVTVYGVIAQGAASKPTPAAPAEMIPNGAETTETVYQSIDRESGKPMALYQVNYPVTGATPEEMARDYLRANATVLHLQDPMLTDLVHRVTRQSLSGDTVRFTQLVAGVPVYQGEIVVHISPARQVTYVSNQYQPTAVSVPTTPGITADTARQTAFAYLQAQGETRLDKTQLVVYVQQGTPQLAYQVRVISAAPLGDWELLIDAQTGNLLKVDNLAHNQDDTDSQADGSEAILVDGTGNIFNADPLSSAHTTYGSPGFTDGNDANTTELTGELMNVTLQDIQFSGGMHTLIGPYAHIQDFESPFYGLFSQVSSDFSYNRFDNAFEAVMTYYHIDDSMRYINETLGIPLTPFQYSGGVRFDPHGLNGADNSHYLPGSGQVSFGEGGVDDNEDADVIWHELGHGLHDWLTNGSLSQVNGLSEGFGDYWAQSHSRILNQWTTADAQYHWVFNWDGHNPFWNGRITNYPGHYPEDLTGQIHTDGQIWSTCLMGIWDEIGRERLDTAVLEGLSMTNSTTNQSQAANAVYQAAIDMNYAYAELLAMNSRFAACGYTMPDLPSPYDLALSGDSALTGLAGTTVTHTVTLTNTGGVSDTFDVLVSGQTWGTAPVTATLFLLAGTSGTVEVAVDIPANALGNESDSANFTATSQGDPNQSETAVLTTIAQAIYGVALASDQSGAGAAGGVVMYTLQISNTGNTTDTFDFSAATANWEVFFETPTVTLAAGSSADVVVHVHIPSDATNGEMDTAVITAVSQNDVAATATVTLTTTATGYTLYLPVVTKN